MADTITYKNKKYIRCRKSTKVVDDIFGNVKSVYIEENGIGYGVDIHGDWSGFNMVIEFKGGRRVWMSNSEWAWMEKMPKAED